MLDKLKDLLKVRRTEPGGTELVYVYLPEDLDPVERHRRYERMLDAELQLQSLGYVSGGGSQVGAERPDGSRETLFSGVDVDAVDVPRARALLRDQLPSLGCPVGTQLHFREDGAPLQDEYDGSDWQLDRPRSLLHPAFGI